MDPVCTHCELGSPESTWILSAFQGVFESYSCLGLRITSVKIRKCNKKKKYQMVSSLKSLSGWKGRGYTLTVTNPREGHPKGSRVHWKHEGNNSVSVVTRPSMPSPTATSGSYTVKTDGRASLLPQPTRLPVPVTMALGSRLPILWPQPGPLYLIPPELNLTAHSGAALK